MRFSLRQLQVFVTTAKYENISKAAQHLSMSQSAASDSLRELEALYNTQLFDRVGKRLQLNETGQDLLPHAEELMTRARELEQNITSQVQSGSLKIGATQTVATTLALPLISNFQKQYPKSQLTLEIGNTLSISMKVANFELDVALIEGEINNPQLNIVPWVADELQVFCHPEHPLSNQHNLKEQNLLEYNWILREPGSGTRQTFDRVMHDMLPQLTIALELQQNEAVLTAVKENLGLGCLSRLCLTQAVTLGEICLLPVARRRFQRNFYLITHKNKYQSLAMKQWLALVKSSETEINPAS